MGEFKWKFLKVDLRKLFVIMNATTMERISANDTCSMRPRNWSRQPCLRDSASNNADFSRLFFYFAANCHRFVYVSGVGDY